jgi:hypothetical protein
MRISKKSVLIAVCLVFLVIAGVLIGQGCSQKYQMRGEDPSPRAASNLRQIGQAILQYGNEDKFAYARPQAEAPKFTPTSSNAETFSLNSRYSQQPTQEETAKAFHERQDALRGAPTGTAPEVAQSGQFSGGNTYTGHTAINGGVLTTGRTDAGSQFSNSGFVY